MITKILAVALVSASAGLVAMPAAAQITLQIGPPVMQYEAVPAPRPGYGWAPGYWNYESDRHVWVAGNWQADRPGYRYDQTRWVERDGHWYQQQGGWARGNPNRDNDGDGVPNKYDRAPNNPNRR